MVKSRKKSSSVLLKKYEKAYENCIMKAMKNHPRMSKKKNRS